MAVHIIIDEGANGQWQANYDDGHGHASETFLPDLGAVLSWIADQANLTEMPAPAEVAPNLDPATIAKIQTFLDELQHSSPGALAGGVAFTARKLQEHVESQT